MRGVTSATTSSKDALFLVCLNRWLRLELANVEDRVVAAAEQVRYFPVHTDYELAEPLMEKLAGLGDEFMAFTSRDVVCQEILRYFGTEAYPMASRAAQFRASFQIMMVPELGRILKTTKWWADNLGRMKKEREELKKVRKVMES